MPIDPAQRHQIEQDAITAAWEAERLAACDDAIALLREIADLEADDDGDVILGADEHGHNDLMSRIKSFLADHDQQEETTMTKLTETQSLILTAGTQRPDNLAMPLPKGLAGAAAKMAVTKMIERGWLQEVDANLRRGDPLWRETGDGHGTTLVVTDAGLQPTPELENALVDLQVAFAALERVTDTLDFQRVSEIRIVADPDWADLWLAPRLPAFRATHPNILFCINGSGDVPLRPLRLGTPDVRVIYGDGPGEPLFTDIFLPVTGPDNPRRIAKLDPDSQMEGMPLLHLKIQRENSDYPGWVEWFQKFGHRESGPDRGVHYRHTRLALEAVRQDVGFLVCGLSLVLSDLEHGSIVRPFPILKHLRAPYPYRLKLRQDAEKRPQVQRFVAWLRNAASETRREIENMAAQVIL